MENILNKIYSHYLNDEDIKKKKKEILSRNDLTNNYIIDIRDNPEKIQNFKSGKDYILTEKKLFLSQFPKEVIINNLLKKELPDNIINIHNYYFSEKLSILIMDNEGVLFKEFLIKYPNDYNILNSIFKQIFFILAILQDKFQFMHKNLDYNSIIIKKYNHNSIKYKLKDKEYEIETFNYIPVLLNFSFSTIFKIYDTPMEIYDKQAGLKIVPITNIINSFDFNTKYKKHIINNNYFISSLDIFNLFHSIKYNKPKLGIKLYFIDIIGNYSVINNFNNSFNYSESYMSLEFFIIQNYFDTTLNTQTQNQFKTEADTELKIDQATVNKYKNAIIVILKNGLGNKLMTIVNLIHKYKGKPIYFLEKISNHQIRSFYDRLKYIFPNLNTDKNYSLMSWNLFDTLQKFGIKETKYNDHDVYYTIPGFINLKDSTRNLLKMNSNYDYLPDKYDLRNGIFVHYRLGDKFELNYSALNDNKSCSFILLKAEYYINNIMKMLKEKTGPVYIMSDSIEVAKCLLKDKIPDAIFINEKTAETFFLMTHCNRLIISDSSMTVAAIYLNNNKPQVIAPNFVVDFYNTCKLNNNFFYNKDMVTFDNNKEYLLNTKEDYDIIYKQCFSKNSRQIYKADDADNL